MLEMRFSCQVLAGWWRTYHNIDADCLTRCSLADYEREIMKRGWKTVDIKASLVQALEDSKQFGPCFLSWVQEEDRSQLVQIKAHRQGRQLQKTIQVDWTRVHVRKWINRGRQGQGLRRRGQCNGGCGGVSGEGGRTDASLRHRGGRPQGAQLPGGYCTSHCGWRMADHVGGPAKRGLGTRGRGVREVGLPCDMDEFVTTEFGECLARRRRVMMVSHRGPCRTSGRMGW